jgi:hypothetical protein
MTTISAYRFTVNHYKIVIAENIRQFNGLSKWTIMKKIPPMQFPWQKNESSLLKYEAVNSNTFPLLSNLIYSRERCFKLISERVTSFHNGPLSFHPSTNYETSCFIKKR